MGMTTYRGDGNWVNLRMENLRSRNAKECHLGRVVMIDLVASQCMLMVGEEKDWIFYFGFARFDSIDGCWRVEKEEE